MSALALPNAAAPAELIPGGARQWLGALLLAALAHGSVFLWWDAPARPASGALAAGTDGLEVGVGLAGSYVEARAAAAPPEPVTPLESAPEDALDAPPEAAAAPKPKPRRKPPETPKPQAETPPRPIPPTSAAQPDVTAVNAPTDAPAAADPSQSAQRATGTGSRAQTGGNPAARQSYLAEVLARIAQHKRYPRAARRDGVTGVVTVRFTVLANGTVQTQQVIGSSGNSDLDKAALEMLERASPLPPIPPEMLREMGMDRLELTVPVEFALNQKRSLF